MPYTVRQQPGPKNALGRVKFMFPNKHAVYLHDTPSRYNFKRTTRAFSSGCIRVENPFELAALLLDDQPSWSRAHIDAVLASGERTTIRLTTPLPVLILYWTAFVDLDGTVHFQDDLYGRDAALLAALKGPVGLHQRHRDKK
jgi:murein L,D-transpeptidase YcbB/YkuD